MAHYKYESRDKLVKNSLFFFVKQSAHMQERGAKIKDFHGIFFGELHDIALLMLRPTSTL